MKPVDYLLCGLPGGKLWAVIAQGIDLEGVPEKMFQWRDVTWPEVKARARLNFKGNNMRALHERFALFDIDTMRGLAAGRVIMTFPYNF